MSYRHSSPDVLRLDGSYRSQFLAVQSLVRPEEVRHLIRWTPPSRVVTFQPQPFAGQTARWLQGKLERGELSYIADPNGFLDYWCAPGLTLRRGGGDCEDLTLLIVSLLIAGGVQANVAIGTAGGGGHAWVEGVDAQGGFVIEATTGELHRHWRPGGYTLHWNITPRYHLRAA